MLYAYRLGVVFTETREVMGRGGMIFLNIFAIKKYNLKT